MKVFLSWSGELSHKVALVLRDWIPSVIQNVEPYVSSEDIDKGTRWSTDIAKELGASTYGILCVTSENLGEPWLNFEAGALSKAFDKANVSPFLFNIKRSEIREGPILQFQSTIFSEDDIKKLMKGINKACDKNCLPDDRLEKVFEVWWPRLEENLKDLLNRYGEKKTPEVLGISQEESITSEILEEILELARNQQKLLRSPETLLPRRYLEHIIKRINRPLRTDRSGGIDSRVLAELDFYWKKLRQLVSENKEKETIPIEPLFSIVVRMEEPIGYILDEFQRRRLQQISLDDE